ncbi:MAG TPA: hypothetical protein HPP87_00050 [Planctomycetes bacterium]|nr:hypothetical protein [Planctomycetota bacterium]
MDTKDEFDFNQGRLGRRMPLDVRIIAWLFVGGAIITFFMVALSLFGLLNLNPDYSPSVLFGLVSLDSNFTSAIYYLLCAVLELICAYGLITGRAYAWWLTMMHSVIIFFDAILLYSHVPTAATLSMAIVLSIVVWLLSRRRLYGIGGGLKST